MLLKSYKLHIKTKEVFKLTFASSGQHEDLFSFNLEGVISTVSNAKTIKV